MNRQRPKTVSNEPPLPQRQILFMPDTGKLANLVTLSPEGEKKDVGVPVKFTNAIKAFKWCQKNKIGFVYYIGADLSQN